MSGLPLYVLDNGILMRDVRKEQFRKGSFCF